jgi:hypothetical protein
MALNSKLHIGVTATHSLVKVPGIPTRTLLSFRLLSRSFSVSP